MDRWIGPVLALALLAMSADAAPGLARDAAAGLRPDARTTVLAAAGAVPVRERALAEMERLRDEIRTLSAVRDAQAALLAWNRERTKTGAAPAALPQALCRDPAMTAWCQLLPATFGRNGPGEESRGEAHDGD